MLRKTVLSLISAISIAMSGFPAVAQSVLTPITQGLVWTPAQWTTAWQHKQDYPATTPVPLLNWTSTTRPSSPPTGGIGYNSTLGSIEFWTGSSWVTGGGGGGGGGFNTTTAACANAAGDGAIIQTAVNTGKTVFIQGPCVLDSTVTITTPGQLIYGSGRDVTQLNVPSNAVGTFGTGVFVVKESGTTIDAQLGPIFQDFSVNFQQADPTCTDVHGYISGTTLTVTSITGGSLSVGTYLDVGTYTVSPNTNITAFGTGTGGTGTYTVNISQTAGSSGSPVLFIPEGSCSRSTLTNYPAAFYAQNQDSVRMFRMKITGAMLGIDGRGASQFVIDDLQESAFSIGMWFDGGGDTNRINNWHFWPFGADPNTALTGLTMTPNQLVLFGSPNNSCAVQTTTGSAGAIGLYSGQGFLQISNHLTISGQGWCIHNGASINFGPQIQATNIDFDTFPGINMSAGDVHISSADFGGALHNYYAVNQTGGSLSISSSWFGNGSPVVAPTAPIVTYQGGFENGSSGVTGSMSISNSRFVAAASPTQAILANSATGNGKILITDNVFEGCACTYSTPFVQVTSASVFGNINSNLFIGSTSSSNNAIGVTTDTWLSVIGNNAPGWGLSFPSTQTEGIYTCNNSSSTVACGSGGITGTINNGTAGQVAVYSGTNTISSSATPSVSQLTVTGTSPSIILPTNGQLQAGGKLALYGDGAGHTYFGDVPANGGAGIILQNNAFPATDSAYSMGTSSFRWTNGYFSSGVFINSNPAISVSGAVTSGQCPQFSGTSGVVVSAACSGGGSGTITGVTAGNQMTGGGNSGTVTVGVTTTPSFSSLTLPVNGVLQAGGKVGLYGDGTHTYLGDVPANGGAGIILQNNSFPSIDNNFSIGTSSFRWTTVYATTGTINTSDARDKDVVSDEDLGLDFIRSLHPVAYRWKHPLSGQDGVFHGLLAQEVEEALGDHDFAGLVRPNPADGENGRYGMRYTEYVAPLIKADQQMADEIDALKAEVAELKAMLTQNRPDFSGCIPISGTWTMSCPINATIH